MNENEIRDMKAIDVRPYLHAIVCRHHETDKPFANDVCYRRWSSDGTQIVFGLDSHNWVAYKPDDLVPVVDIEHGNIGNEWVQTQLDEDLKRMKNRPTPTVTCPCCLGTSRVPRVPPEFADGVWVDGGSTYEVVDGQIVRRL